MKILKITVKNLILISLLLIMSCEKQEETTEPTWSWNDVYVRTLTATDIGSSSATLNGQVTDIQGDYTAGFSYGRPESMLLNAKTAHKDSDGKFHANISGLQSNVRYYFRAYVVNGNNYEDGNTKSFLTSK